MKEIILIGAGGHAGSCIDVIETEGRFRIAGGVGRDVELHQRLCGYEVIASDKDFPKLATEYGYALVTVGQIKSPQKRIHLYEQVRKAGLMLPVIVSPYAHVSKHARIGDGTVVMHGSTVNTNARVGVNCIINSRVLVEHDAAVGDHCHISTGAILNGNVQVGARSFVGSGTVTKHGVSVGADCVIGMGSVVRHNLPEETTFWPGGGNG